MKVRNLGDSLKYYTEILGFTEDFRLSDYAGIKYGEVTLHLCGHDVHEQPAGGGAVFIFCDEVDVYFQELTNKGVTLRIAVGDRPYGMRDFTVVDPDGNRLSFGCEIAAKSSCE